MNQVKIGKFIAQCRKEKNMTQAELAEKLNITDRAISKWETGKGMPDSSIMLDLCNELNISVNELLSGEVIEMNDYDKKAEENLLKLNKSNQYISKKLLQSIIAIILLVLIFIVIGLYNFIKQVSKSDLDSTLTQAQSIYEINIKIQELEEKINALENIYY